MDLGFENHLLDCASVALGLLGLQRHCKKKKNKKKKNELACSLFTSLMFELILLAFSIMAQSSNVILCKRDFIFLLRVGESIV